jgi:GTP:adenosylcobinamide-phosphate guanylyltransferase
MTEARPFSVVILAAQRTGVVNPLAVRAGVSHKCLVPIVGKPLIVHVIEALEGYPGLAGVRISVEPEVHGELAALLSPFTAKGMVIECVTSSTNIVESMLAAVAGQRAPYLITTADNVLLAREAIGEALAALETCDVVATLAARPSVVAIHPEAQRRFYVFRDEGYANCNLYAIAGQHAFRAAEVFREGGQFMKNPKRLIRAFGLFNILAMRFRLVTLAGAMKLASRRFKVKIRALVPADGAQAVDVDDERTYMVAEMVLKQRKPTSPA